MTQIENLKKSIKTILHLFENLLIKYSLEDQKLINDFLEIIKHFEKADNKRNLLIAQFSEYSKDVRRNKQYHVTPFLGLTVKISENAIYQLSISRYHPYEYYGSLLQQLRLLFHLFKTKEPLESNEFEEILQKIKMLHNPLTFNEFRFLNQTYSILKAGGIESLYSNYIRTEIGNSLEIKSQFKKKSEISRLYTLVEGRWWIHFHSSAFGLSRVFFRFERKKNVPLAEILDLNDQKNTVLCNSSVYQVRGSNTEYIGTFLVPSKDVSLLKTFFQRCEDNGSIISKELTTLNCRRRSISFKNYKEGTGWRKLSRSKEQQITKFLTSPNLNERTKEELLLNFTSPANPQWQYTEYQSPEQIIELYCRSPTEYSYANLPFNIGTENNSGRFSRRDVELLYHMYKINIINIGFIPWRLIDDYSTNIFFVKTSNLPLAKLEHFLNVIPYAEVYFSSKDQFIWSVLSPEMVKWIKNSLRWPVIPVQRIHAVKNLNFHWFETKTLQWLTPELIKYDEIR